MLTEQQRQARRQFIGGSDAPVVLGVSRYKSKYELYLEKRGELPDSAAPSEPMEWGNRLEPIIGEVYAERTGRRIRRIDTLRHPEHPFMGLNADFEIVDDPRGRGYLEIKNFGFWSGREIHDASTLPDEVYVQVQHGLAFPRFAWGSVAILIGGQRLFWCDVEPHHALIAHLISAEREFWAGVQTGRPPACDGMAPETVSALYPTDRGTTVELTDPSVCRLAQDLLHWAAVKKQAEQEYDQRAAAIKLLMQDAAEAVIPGFGRVTWRASRVGTKRVIDEERLRRDYPDVYRACLTEVRTGGVRTFRLKPDAPNEGGDQ